MLMLEKYNNKEFEKFMRENRGVNSFEVFKDEAKKFNSFLAKFYWYMDGIDIDSKTLYIFYRMLKFVSNSGGILRFSIDKEKEDEEEIFRVIRKLERAGFVEEIEVKETEREIDVELQLIGYLKEAYDDAFVKQQEQEDANKKETLVSALLEALKTEALLEEKLEKELKKINMGCIRIFGDKYYRNLSDETEGFLYKPFFNGEKELNMGIKNLEEAGVFKILKNEKTSYGRWLEVQVSDDFKELYYQIVRSE